MCTYVYVRDPATPIKVQLEGPNMPNHQEPEVVSARTGTNRNLHKTHRNHQEPKYFGYRPAGTDSHHEHAGTRTWKDKLGGTGRNRKLLAKNRMDHKMNSRNFSSPAYSIECMVAAITCCKLQFEWPNMPDQKEPEVAFTRTGGNRNSQKSSRNWQDTKSFGYKPAETGGQQEPARIGTWTRQNFQEPAGNGITWLQTGCITSWTAGVVASLIYTLKKRELLKPPIGQGATECIKAAWIGGT